MTKWNKNLDILPSNYFPNYVMPELKPFQCNATCWGDIDRTTPNVRKLKLKLMMELKHFQCNTTCWGDIDRAASHTQCLKVILGHSLEMGFQLLTVLPPIDACNTLDIFKYQYLAVATKWSTIGHQVTTK